LDYDGIYIAQGRDTSGDTPVMNPRPFEISEFIPADAKIKVHARGCELGKNTTYVIGANLGTASAINLIDNVEYSLIISYRGSLVRRLQGRNFSVSRPSVLIDGTFAQLGLGTDAAKLDYIVSNLVHQTNKESVIYPGLGQANNPIVALGLGQSTAATGVALSTITVGQVLVVGTLGAGNPVSVKVTNALYASIQAAIASGTVDGGDKVIPVNIDALTGEVEKFIIMALDRDLVDTDREPIMKYRLDIALNDGFAPNVAISEVVKKQEDVGNPRQVQLQYADYAELNKQFRVQPPSGNAFLYPTDVDPTKAYMLIDIEWLLEDESTISHGTSQPLFYTIAIPCCEGDIVDAWGDKLNDVFGPAPNVRFRGPHAVTASRFNLPTTSCSASYAAPYKTIT